MPISKGLEAVRFPRNRPRKKKALNVRTPGTMRGRGRSGSSSTAAHNEFGVRSWLKFATIASTNARGGDVKVLMGRVATGERDRGPREDSRFERKKPSTRLIRRAQRGRCTDAASWCLPAGVNSRRGAHRHPAEWPMYGLIVGDPWCNLTLSPVRYRPSHA